VLAGMAVAFFTVCYNTTALINALPVIAAEFHFSIVNLQWMINGYVLVAVAFISLSGKLGDIFDKKKVFLFGAAGYILASIMSFARVIRRFYYFLFAYYHQNNIQRS
jgi:DHA2 family methylenomycin A resistance protein-like MFS transporter